MPAYNKLLDCGAAGQNIVLAAHACGLGGCWLTFTGDKFRQRIVDYLKIPDYIDAVTYVDVGYPDQSPAPPLRHDLSEAILYRDR
jgi:nitroreductase